MWAMDASERRSSEAPVDDTWKFSWKTAATVDHRRPVTPAAVPRYLSVSLYAPRRGRIGTVVEGNRGRRTAVERAPDPGGQTKSDPSRAGGSAQAGAIQNLHRTRRS